MASADDVVKELERILEDLSTFSGAIGESARESLSAIRINKDKIKNVIDESLKEFDSKKKIEKIIKGLIENIKLSQPNDLKYLVLGIAIIEALLTSKAVQLEYA